jgi:hypothetical protein
MFIFVQSWEVLASQSDEIISNINTMHGGEIRPLHYRQN